MLPPEVEPALLPTARLSLCRPAKTQSPEDVNFEGKLDNYGAMNPHRLSHEGSQELGEWRRSCAETGRRRYGIVAAKNSARRNRSRGFTVASENRMYIQGDDNSNSTDPTWNNLTATEPAHPAAAVIADAVTLLSNQWTQNTSLNRPSHANGGGVRPAVTTRYRRAIAAGKTINFPNPSLAGRVLYGYGSDGGLHDFLPFLEDWSGNSLYYKGSLVSLYCSIYATGTFKYCGYSVYQPPDRNYFLILSSPGPTACLQERPLPRCRKLIVLIVMIRLSRREPTSRKPRRALAPLENQGSVPPYSFASLGLQPVMSGNQPKAVTLVHRKYDFGVLTPATSVLTITLTRIGSRSGHFCAKPSLPSAWISNALLGEL
jgi:hypothetical protein